MKKIIALVITIIAILTFTCSVYAEEITETAPDINEQITVTEEEEKGIIDTLMNSTVWASIGSYVAMALSVIIVIYKKFGGVSDLIKSKADNATVLSGVKSVVNDAFSEVQKQLAETKNKLAATEENEKKLATILSLYIMNAKINSNAKAEIMQYVNGIKDINGSISEICDTVAKAIEEADKAEEKIETPALDAVVSEVSSYGIALD